jgi:hypothetical protein
MRVLITTTLIVGFCLAGAGHADEPRAKENANVKHADPAAPAWQAWEGGGQFFIFGKVATAGVYSLPVPGMLPAGVPESPPLLLNQALASADMTDDPTAVVFVYRFDGKQTKRLHLTADQINKHGKFAIQSNDLIHVVVPEKKGP